MKTKRVQEEVEKTMRVLDQLAPVTANPYLETRLKARLRSRPSARSGIWQWAVLAMILVLNSATIFHWFQQDRTASSSTYEQVAKEYSWDTSASWFENE